MILNLIKKEFFLRDTLTVAKELLGCVIVRNDNGLIQKGKIVETEAYTQEDPACHAYRGKTKRALTLYKEGGISYVYLIYGMYHCLNFVAREEDYGSAVLIRALEPIENVENTNGPGKLCREMKIDRSFNEINVCSDESPVYLLEGDKIPEKNIITTTRIGIKEAADYPWRFYIKDNKFVSKK